MKVSMIISIAAVVLIIAGVWFFFSGPSYQPGKMKERKDLADFLKIPAQDGSRPGFWKVQEGVELYYFSEGQGKPALVVHGGPGFPIESPWKGLNKLTKQYQFYYYNQRGCGKSTRLIDQFSSKNYYQNMQEVIRLYGIEQQIADIDRIRRILKQDKITLIGHSFGGFIAALYAIEFPDKVEKLVLVSPADMLKMPQKSGGLFTSILNTLPGGKTREDYKDFMKRYFDYGKIFSKTEKEQVDLNLEFAKYYAEVLKIKGLIPNTAEISTGGAGGWMVPGLYFSLGRSHDYTKALSAVQCPVLIFHGGRDFVMTMDGINTYAANLKNAQLQVLSNSGHNSFDDQPDEFAAAMAGFLK